MRELLVVLAITSALGLTACGSDEDGGGDAAEKPALKAAYDACEAFMVDAVEQSDIDTMPEASEFIRSTDDGAGIIIDTPEPRGEIASMYAMRAATCVLDESDGPETIADKMGNTTAMMGMQEDTYGDVEVSWSYSAGVNGSGFSATFQQSH